MRRIGQLKWVGMMVVGVTLWGTTGRAQDKDAAVKGSSAAPSACLSVVVPSYMYPSAKGSGWDTAIASPVGSRKVERVMIANPASGPGKAANKDFQRIVKAAHQAGNKVYGYVPTGYGKDDLHIVREQIRAYATWYGVDGIFVDEVSAEAAEVKRYYQPVAKMITGAIKGGGVMLNAGTYPDASYAAIRVPATSKLQIVVFESGYAAFTASSFAVPGWVRKYPASMFVDIVYETPREDVGKVLRLAVERGDGSVYVTDEKMPDPYAALPSYWDALNREVQAGCGR